MAQGADPKWPVLRAVAGGASLRTLRQDAGLSLNDLAGRIEDQGAGIDAAHLQRIESGKIRRPAAETLDAILIHGLDAPFRTRRDVLDAYGYRLPWALPTEREIEEGRRLCAQELLSATWPAYLMDHGQRLWAWNRSVPRLLGLAPDDPAPARFVGLTVLDLVFNPAVGVNLMIANPERYRPLFLRMFKIQTQPHAHEPWFQDLLARAWSWPGFAELWPDLPEDADEVLATQPIVPIEFRVPGVEQPLRFRIALIYLSLDSRFQVVHWIPYGAATLRHCALWAEEDGEW
ncbi:MAG: helix-turn-helix transcriptional regulator [Chloroflexota bacterium]|nr:helix-turn-helix transcriptional regulator [Chloroflexota bacterium]